MAGRFESSSRYLHQSPADVAAEQKRLAEGDIARIEPLSAPPDYLSIIWLASKIGLYNEPHPNSTAIKGTFFIGQGATFSVYRAEYKDKVYAVKQPRLVFEYSQYEAHTMQQLYSLHLELRVLTDRNIRTHGNIVKLNCIHWEEYPDNLGRYWPSLVMEHADHGTLATCYGRNLQLTVDSEKLLCFAIGDALAFLHGNGVIHGDIKPDNILMFKGKESGGLILKLSDFGFSVLDKNVSPRLLGGTPDWEAPETLENTILQEDLAHADSYSFGLLLWYIARNGISPFDKISELQVPLESRKAREAIRSLKKTKDICRIATASLVPEKAFYSRAFDLTLSRDPRERNLISATICFNSETSADYPPSTVTSSLLNRTQESEVSPLETV